MADQVQRMRFCWPVCGIRPVYPPKGPAPWPLTKTEREHAGYIAAVFHLIVRTVAAELCDTGVPLDPDWGGDRAALAVLMPLPEPGYPIPWDGKIDEFAEVLQPPGVSAFTPDGRSAHTTAGRMAWPATRTASVSSSGPRTAAVNCTCPTPAGQAGRCRASP
jgi:hypothetical protein